MEKLNKLRKETIKKLNNVKDNLKDQDNERNYCDMINTMIDYDNEAQDNLYLYDNCQETVKFVDEELLQYYVEHQIKEFGTSRVPYMFKGVDYEDDIYKCNAYGNLENINDGDFESCIDEAIETLKNAIESEDK